MPVTTVLTTFSEVWNVLFAFINVLIACGCFLLGVNQMSKGFVNICVKRNSSFMAMFKTRSKFKGMLAGLFHSGLTQSSDATTVFTIRMINVGAITLLQAACIIMGANIGTTLTGFIISLSHFNVTPYFAFMAFPGALLLLGGNPKYKGLGEILSGFGVLFVGIELLNKYIADPLIAESLTNVFTCTSEGWLLVLLGLGLTAIVQSSSVCTSIVILMFGGGLITPEGAFFMAIGANIGTCVTALIASRNGNVNTRRVAFIHLFFNLVGAAIFTTIMYLFPQYVTMVFDFLHLSNEFQVSMFCLIFNTVTMLLLLPLARPIVWFARTIIRK